MPAAEPSHTCGFRAHGVAERLNAVSEAGSLDSATGAAGTDAADADAAGAEDAAVLRLLM